MMHGQKNIKLSFYTLKFVDQCFSTFVRPRPVKFFFYEVPVPKNLLVNPFPIFLSSYIKLT